MAKHPDVAIIGGGIIGLTSAYFLAKEGLSVEVFDRGDFGKEASWAGAGIIPPGNPVGAATPVDRLRSVGSVRFPAFSQELKDRTGIGNGYLRCGGFEFLTADDAEVMEVWRAEGIHFERLPLRDARRLEPTLGEVQGEPCLLPACSQVRNPWHVRALVAACETVGVRLRPNIGAEDWGLDRERERVESLRLVNGERLHADRFLIATGAWSEPLLRTLGHTPRVHPVRGQIALLNGRGPSRILMFGKRYLVPRGDGLVLIGSTEEPEAGFDKRTTEAGVEGLLAFAREAVPVLSEATLQASWAGLRPGTPDGLPFIGPVPGWKNAFLATGHFRAGLQLSIGTAQAITELFTSKPTCVSLQDFAIDRKPRIGGKVAFRS